MLLEGVIIVEIKAIETFNRIHLAKLISYLKHTRRSVGLLINFHVGLLKDGIRRVVEGDTSRFDVLPWPS